MMAVLLLQIVVVVVVRWEAAAVTLRQRLEPVHARPSSSASTLAALCEARSRDLAFRMKEN
jgi:hypothetical protein